ncbi:MAG: hypothetical protein FWE78_01570 [Methanimicrococcus sp.]|nr:hypothetical protein [Methanimicrococcus sp.]
MEERRYATSFAENAAIQNQLNEVSRELENERASTAAIQRQLNALLEGANADNVLLQENIRTQVLNSSLITEIGSKTNQLITLESDLNKAKRDLITANSNLSDINALFVSEQAAKAEVERMLSDMDRNVQASFEMKDLAKYLTGVIDEFNNSANTGDASVNYIIKELDLEMKAYIAKTDNDQLRMSAPSLSANSDEALSRIRFTIGAVPKDITPE